MGKKNLLLAIFACAIQSALQAQTNAPAYRYIGQDSAITHASDQYVAGSFLRNFLMGKNYRKEWEQPVILPVFRLSQTTFTRKELGGGKQTKSLHLTDDKGKEWSLRMLEKNVMPSLPDFLRNSLAEKLLQDQISSLVPFGALIVGALAQKAHILTAMPTIYFVADDTAFGPYQQLFANRMCILEERDPGFAKTVGTEYVLHRLQSTSTYVVDQKNLLKARLLDMLVNDVDRHYDNWRWGIINSDSLHTFYAIPKDRDWAFYYSDGLIPKLARVMAIRFLINFDETPKYIISQNAKAHTFDACFLNELNAADWQQGVADLQQQLSDEAIEAAVKTMPPPAFAIHGNNFIQKLKSRRDALRKAASTYYLFLSKKIQVDGSNDAEIFSFHPAKDGFVLQIYRAEDSTGKRLKIYERTFRHSETYQLLINGLGGDDRFEIDEGVNTKIKLKLNGGTGNDSYQLNGNIRIEVNDDAVENNYISNKNGSKVYLR